MVVSLMHHEGNEDHEEASSMKFFVPFVFFVVKSVASVAVLCALCNSAVKVVAVIRLPPFASSDRIRPIILKSGSLCAKDMTVGKDYL